MAAQQGERPSEGAPVQTAGKDPRRLGRRAHVQLVLAQVWIHSLWWFEEARHVADEGQTEGQARRGPHAEPGREARAFIPRHASWKPVNKDRKEVPPSDM